MFYSKETRGFYSPEVHGSTIPADAVAVSDDLYSQLLSGQGQGLAIGWDDNAMIPKLVQPPISQSSKLAAIKAERDRRSVTGGYMVGDKWFHSDTFSRTQQIGLVMMGINVPANLQWKTMDGSFVTMTPQLASQIFAAAAASDHAVFAAAELHRAAMESSNDPAGYDFSTGWPPVFGE